MTNYIFIFCKYNLIAVLLALPFLFDQAGVFVWFMYVPLLVLSQRRNYLSIYLIVLVTTIIGYLYATHWVYFFFNLVEDMPILLKSGLSFVYWAYCANLNAVIFVVSFYLNRITSISLCWIFPTVFVVISSVYPMLFKMTIADTQVSNLMVLQPIEWFGAEILTWFVCYINVVIAKILFSLGGIKTSENPLRLIRYGCIHLLLPLTVWFSIGYLKLNYWTEVEDLSSSLNVGVVQTNEQRGQMREEGSLWNSYLKPVEFNMSDVLESNSVDLIVWPETETRGSLVNDEIKAAYQNFFKDLKTPLVYQDQDTLPSSQLYERGKTFNTAVFIENGKITSKYYKEKLVPFGEYVPVSDSYPMIQNWIKKYITGFMQNFSVGENNTPFNLGDVSILPLICYEVTFPQYVATQFREQRSLGMNARFSVVMSNTNWVKSESLSRQFSNSVVVRAIENRASFVNVLNNGPSFVVSPSGKVEHLIHFDKRKTLIAAVPLTYPSQSTFYTQHPKLFASLCLVTLLMLLLIGAFRKLNFILSLK